MSALMKSGLTMKDALKIAIDNSDNREFQGGVPLRAQDGTWLNVIPNSPARGFPAKPLDKITKAVFSDAGSPMVYGPEPPPVIAAATSSYTAQPVTAVSLSAAAAMAAPTSIGDEHDKKTARDLLGTALIPAAGGSQAAGITVVDPDKRERKITSHSSEEGYRHSSLPGAGEPIEKGCPQDT